PWRFFLLRRRGVFATRKAGWQTGKLARYGQAPLPGGALTGSRHCGPGSYPGPSPSDGYQATGPVRPPVLPTFKACKSARIWANPPRSKPARSKASDWPYLVNTASMAALLALPEPRLDW